MVKQGLQVIILAFLIFVWVMVFIVRINIKAHYSFVDSKVCCIIFFIISFVSIPGAYP